MRQLMPLLLLTICVNAFAEWVKVGDTHQLGFEKYIDPDNVKQTGPMAIMRQVWEIGNYSQPTKDGVVSVQTLVEYNCQTRELRVVKEQWFTEAWAKGKEVTAANLNQAVSAWSPITPNSVGAVIIDMACPDGRDG